MCFCQELEIYPIEVAFLALLVSFLVLTLNQKLESIWENITRVLLHGLERQRKHWRKLFLIIWLVLMKFFTGLLGMIHRMKPDISIMIVVFFVHLLRFAKTSTPECRSFVTIIITIPIRRLKIQSRMIWELIS